MSDQCRIPGCDNDCGRGFLMCRACWALVPPHLQRAMARSGSQASKRAAFRAARDARRAQAKGANA